MFVGAGLCGVLAVGEHSGAVDFCAATRSGREEGKEDGPPLAEAAVINTLLVSSVCLCCRITQYLSLRPISRGWHCVAGPRIPVWCGGQSSAAFRKHFHQASVTVKLGRFAGMYTATSF